MRVVIQRVKKANISVGGQLIAGIDKGLLLLIGLSADDTETDLCYAAEKIKGLRVFEDENKKMNLDVKQVKGEILSVPQFTLFGDIRNGKRPSFIGAAEPVFAQMMWEKFNVFLSEGAQPVKTGRFGAKMQVELINDGPVTILLDTKQR